MSMLAYLTSEYPARSHTFIRREIYELRKRGLKIDVVAIRRPQKATLLCEQDWIDYDDTWPILPISFKKLIKSHIYSLIKTPKKYLSTFIASLGHRLPGLKNLIWSIFHFAEAIIVATELRKRGTKHIHVHFANASSTIGYLVSVFCNITFSMTLHGASDFGYPSVCLLGKKIPLCRFALCVSFFGLAQAYRTVENSHWSKLSIYRCGVELNDIRLVKRTKSKNKKIVNVGRLSSEKGQIGLLKAFLYVKQKLNNAELILVGDGPDREKICEFIEYYRIGDSVTLTGAVPEKDVFDIIGKADIFALSSLMEGIPLVLMESMALSVPVVAPRVAGIPELVDDKVNGLLYTPANWTELSEQIIRLAKDERLAGILGANGRKVVENGFNIAKSIDPLYQKLCSI